MIMAHRIALGGIQLDETDDRIIIMGIEEQPPRETIHTVSLAGGGSRVTGRRRESLDLNVKFSILARKQEMSEREEVFEKVMDWARKGGTLTIGQRPGRRMRGTILANAPAIGDPWSWTSIYTMTFRSYGVPYWEDSSAIAYTTGTDTAGSVATENPGNADTRPNITLANRSGATINTAAVTVGKRSMSFTGLGLAGDEKLIIDHDGNDLLRIRILAADGTYRSAMIRRSAESADDFLMAPGKTDASFTAQRACQMTVSVRGRYL